MGDKNIKVSTQFEHSITNLLGHAPTTEPGITLRKWVNHQGIDDFLDLLSWEECWKPSSLLSNMHFRNTTKIAAQVLCS